MFRILARGLRTGVATRRDPFSDRPPFGFPTVLAADCNGCLACVDVCPTGAFTVQSPVPDRAELSLSYAACIQCRDCVDACTPGAIRPGRDFDIAAYSRSQMVRTARFCVDPATGGWTNGQAREEPGPSLEESAVALRERIQGLFGRSLHVRQVDAGSCNGCELEIAATANPVFDLERFGIHYVASPRHADALLVTGPVTRNMEIALRRTWEATPEPRVVVAVGACGCAGGIFGEGTYASIGGVDRVVPVDVYVPGCPPRPHAILNGLLVAMGRRHPHGFPGPPHGPRIARPGTADEAVPPPS